MAAAASQSSAGHQELDLRPRLRAGDLLESVPGLVVVQPEGGGKANEYFLRGFDADHGTDIAFFADGVPLNMPSHAHGQGYADLNFLMPELLVRVDGYTGPYSAQFGDFATAGAVNMRLAEAFPESRAQYSIGPYGIVRGLVIESPSLGDDWRTVTAADFYKEDGPFVHPEGLGKYSVYARATHDLTSRSKVSVTWMSYGSDWDASGQVPSRAVCGDVETADCISRFGTVDPSQGGSTQRHSLSVAYTARSEVSDLTATAYVIRYDFRMFSNFTFFAEDPVNGDEFEQDDDRTTLGGDFRVRRHVHLGAVRLTTTFGLQARDDSIDTGLLHDNARRPLDTIVSAGVGESEVGAYLQEELRLNRYVKFVVGGRGDRVDVDVTDRIGTSSGTAGRGLFSPKYSVVVSPNEQLDVFGDYGRGFHSNDARDVIYGASAASLMVPATGYETGVAVKPVKRLRLTADAFLLDLDSELVWNGDTGTTSPAGRTRRYGVELSGRYRFSSWLFADIDATFTHARFRDASAGEDLVPLAPSRTFSAGLGAKHGLGGGWTASGEVRMRSIDDRPATQDGSLIAQGFTIMDVTASARWKDVEVGLDVQNLLDSAWRQSSFAYTSRLPWEAAPVTDINFTPGWPRTVIGRVAIYWR